MTRQIMVVLMLLLLQGCLANDKSLDAYIVSEMAFEHNEELSFSTLERSEDIASVNSYRGSKSMDLFFPQLIENGNTVEFVQEQCVGVESLDNSILLMNETDVIQYKGHIEKGKNSWAFINISQNESIQIKEGEYFMDEIQVIEITPQYIVLKQYMTEGRTCESKEVILIIDMEG